MNGTNEVLVAASPASPLVRPWEHLLIWVIFALGAFGLFGFPYAAGINWAVVWELTRTGALPVIGFLPPIVFFVGATLLLFRRKSATVWLAVHIPLAITYLSSRHGIASISAFWWFGYICEALFVCFCLRLWSRGALK